MSFVDTLLEKASRLKRKIVLPEGDEIRMLQAAGMLTAQDVVRVVLLGRPDTIRALADRHEIVLSHTVQIVDPVTSEKASDFAREFYQMRKHKGLTYEDALRIMRMPLYFGDMMVRRGEVDGCVAGSVSTTADVLRAAIQVVGVKEGSKRVSSFFLMILPDGRVVTYADCAVVPYPNREELASIAVDAAASHRRLVGEEPRVALLSFSTKGSARHEQVELVQEAVRRAQEKEPALALDGEMQFDTTFVPEVGIRKAPNSPVAGNANVFVFPNLDAGNIGYKITERLGGAVALGPILQGLAHPVNDLSRGCTAEDIVKVAAVTAILSV